MKNKKKSNTKKQFKEALSYIKDSKKYIYTAIILFVVSSLAGFFFKDYLGIFNDIIKELISKTEGMNSPELIFFIFQNNLQAALLGILTGIVFGIFPIFYVILNGLVTGYVVGLSSEAAGLSIIWQLLPHGIFELPAIFISFGLGIKLGYPILTNYLSYYWKKIKYLAYLPLLLALISSLPILLYKKTFELYLEIPLSLIILIVFTINLILYYFIFIFVTYFSNEKLKKLQNKHLRHSFYQSANAFLMIVIPLLIIAAIIEGILIGLLG